MKFPYCTNLQTCKFIIEEKNFTELTQRQYYLTNYYQNPDLNWKNCKRFLVKIELGFCPDFIIPESEMTLNEIIDTIDKNFN